MRFVAGEAAERAAALAKANALAQVDGLVAHVPGVIPVDGHSLRRGRPVTLPAEFIQLRRRQRARIPDVLPRRILRMVRSGPVARFAAHAWFADVRFSGRTERDRTGGVAFEASRDAGVGIAGPIEQPGGLRQRGWIHRVLAGRRAPGTQG